jgi:hypothetical protein
VGSEVSEEELKEMSGLLRVAHLSNGKAIAKLTMAVMHDVASCLIRFA